MKTLKLLLAGAVLASAGSVVPLPVAYAGTNPSLLSANRVAAAGGIDSPLGRRIDALAAGSDLPPAVKLQIHQIALGLPAQADARASAAVQRWGLSNEWSTLADPASCPTTDLSRWLDAQVAEVDPMVLFIMALLMVPSVPAVDSLFFTPESKANTFGIDGSETQQVTITTKKLRGFWDINGAQVAVVPMHGRASLTDPARVARVYELLFGVDAETAAMIADLIRQVFAMYPSLRDGDNPFFTFNAFAYNPADDPIGAGMGVGKKIVLGDGIFAGMNALGLDKVSTRGILAHEYGHEVQFGKGLTATDLTGAEESRRLELMADALATYFMVHSRGLALNAKRVLLTEQTFFEVGDCGVDLPGHHGTPAQRYASVAWAAGVVSAARPQGFVLPSTDFAARFDAALPEILQH